VREFPVRVSFEAADLPGTLNHASAHDTNLSTALRALRRLGQFARRRGDRFDRGRSSDVLTFAEQCRCCRGEYSAVLRL